jgi:hypothetical protein
MMKSLQWLSIGLFLVIFAGTVCAQNETGVGGGVITTLIGSGGGLKGVPFSADVVSETTQVLGDGNHIHRELHGKTVRDSEGRTRNEFESELPDGDKRVIVSISDPAAHLLISLNPQTKTASVHHLKPPSPSAGALHKPSTATTVAPSPGRPATKFESLGTKEIEGFTAKGSRITTTIEAGQIGNEEPIVSVHETWFSQDIGEALLAMTNDPRSGQHVRRLTNIRMGEPDPMLFQVPADYTVKDSQ